jgi:catechol 2,3-dioxygenase-like lactoylglutathione lyase family enzyme
MTLTGLELHHVAVRMHPDGVEPTLDFYRDVLGLEADPETRQIPGIPGFWFDATNDAQVHVFGVEGVSPYARQPERDPFTRHIALGVPDIAAAKAELERLGVEHWRAGRDEAQQVFLDDPSGNMIELHQSGACRCQRSRRSAPGEAGR